MKTVTAAVYYQRRSTPVDALAERRAETITGLAHELGWDTTEVAEKLDSALVAGLVERTAAGTWRAR